MGRPPPQPQRQRRRLARAVALCCAACALGALLWAPATGLASSLRRGGEPLTEADFGADQAAVEALLAAWPSDKPRAVLLVLARNRELPQVQDSMRQLEARFNSQPGRRYPWVFLNDRPFTKRFKAGTARLTSASSLYGLVPTSHWSYPSHINQTRAARARAAAEGKMPYGGSESYRFMCRYFSGFFFRHPLLQGFDWYWRVEPGVDFMCQIPQDPFRHMQAHNKMYGWNLMLSEVPDTIPTLWTTLQAYLAAHPRAAVPNNALQAFTDVLTGSYSGCHFWSNFEIARLDFFRSPAYLALFEHLDASGGFFYERWGDAPVHTLAAALLLDRGALYHAADIGYRHGDGQHCPEAPELRPLCDCDPRGNLLRTASLCTAMYWRVVGGGPGLFSIG